MAKVLQTVCTWLAYVAAALLMFVTAIISVTIVCRLLSLRGPIWVNQFSEYSLLAITFLGTAWLLAQEKHTSVTLVVDSLSPKNRALLKCFHMVTGSLLCGLLTWYTGASTMDHIARGVIDVGSIDVPKGWVLSVIPIGFFLLTCQFLVHLCRYWSAWRTLAEGKTPEAGSLAEAMTAHMRGADAEG